MPSYQGYRFLPGFISHVVWLRFCQAHLRDEAEALDLAGFQERRPGCGRNRVASRYPDSNQVASDRKANSLGASRKSP